MAKLMVEIEVDEARPLFLDVHNTTYMLFIHPECHRVSKAADTARYVWVNTTYTNQYFGSFDTLQEALDHGTSQGKVYKGAITVRQIAW